MAAARAPRARAQNPAYRPTRPSPDRVTVVVRDDDATSSRQGLDELAMVVKALRRKGLRPECRSVVVTARRRLDNFFVSSLLMSG